MRFASFTTHTRSAQRASNPLGATAWSDLAKVFERVQEIRGLIGGVTLQRFCGALPKPRIWGVRTDGAACWCYPASFEEREPTAEEDGWIDRLEALGLVVAIYIGAPVSPTGFESLNLFHRRHPNVLVIADAVGQSTAGGILQRYGVVYEPAPQPGFVPSWFVPGMPTFCMARMARILEGSGYLPLTAHIGFNNDPEGDSHYTAEEAEAFEQAGHSVHVPETFFPRISTTGG